MSVNVVLLPSRWALSARRVLVALLVVALLAVGGAPSPANASAASVDAERDFAALVNVERAKKGLGALTVRTDIVSVARRHSARMASQTKLHHNPTYSTEITGWRRISENVGVGPSVSAIHKALMASAGHRRNILDDQVTQVGIGVTLANGRVWVTQNFRRPLSGATSSPTSLTSFGDVSSTNVHAGSITTVSDRGITDACGTSRFCPTDPVSRAEFATMLVRSLDLPATSAKTFGDISGPHAADIEALAAAGLTAGCGDARFCPDTKLTREQMATFFARALKIPPKASPFRDMSATHDGSVGGLYAEGIVLGCTTKDFCPRTRVTRAQTATMIARNLG